MSVKIKLWLSFALFAISGIADGVSKKVFDDETKDYAISKFKKKSKDSEVEKKEEA